MSDPYETNNAMTCDEFADLLGDVLERSTDEPTRARVEAHALSCADCGPLLADLRKLRIDAANLPELVPSRDLWADIAARIETPVVAIGSGVHPRAARHSHRLAPVWMGLAAAGLVGITATITHEVTKHTMAASMVAQRPVQKTDTIRGVMPAPVSPAVASAPAKADTTTSSRGSSAATLVSNRTTKLSPEQTYDQEITRLRAIVKTRRPQLDSATVAVLEHNLKVIDDAIAQCRQALRKDPNSRFLIESLNDAYDTKVQLLRTAASLPSRA